MVFSEFVFTFYLEICLLKPRFSNSVFQCFFSLFLNLVFDDKGLDFDLFSISKVFCLRFWWLVKTSCSSALTICCLILFASSFIEWVCALFCCFVNSIWNFCFSPWLGSSSIGRIAPMAGCGANFEFGDEELNVTSAGSALLLFLLHFHLCLPVE